MDGIDNELGKVSKNKTESEEDEGEEKEEEEPILGNVLSLRMRNPCRSWILTLFHAMKLATRMLVPLEPHFSESGSNWERSSDTSNRLRACSVCDTPSFLSVFGVRSVCALKKLESGSRR